MEAIEPTMIYCNNIQLAKNPIFHAWTKHIEVVHERVLSSEVELVYVPTDPQAVDIFTKPLRQDKLWQFLSMLGIQQLNMPNLKGRRESESKIDEVQKHELDEEFDFETTKEAEDKCKGSGEENESEP